MPIRESSEAQRKAVKKHDTEMVDKVTIRLPKGTKEKITAMGRAVNSYVIEAVEEKMIRQGVLLPESAENPSKNEKKEEKVRKSEKTQENT